MLGFYQDIFGLSEICFSSQWHLVKEEKKSKCCATKYKVSSKEEEIATAMAKANTSGSDSILETCRG